MKHNFFLALLGIAALLIGILVVAAPAAAERPEFPRNNITPYGPYAIDGTYMLGEKETNLRKCAAQIGPALATGASSVGMPATIDEELTITVPDFGLGTVYDEAFVVIMNGTHGIILVEKAAYDKHDSGNDEYVFSNPYGCFRSEDRIPTAQLDYLLEQFDTVIYPTNTSVFGEPLPRGEEAKKTWILIHNIRDESYYYGPSDDGCNPATLTYIAGYFSASEDAVNNKNMIHIDTGDWERRIGPGVDFPYMYETVFAHEFEHLLHFDQDPDESLWVDEGLANLAAFLCGYGHQAQFIFPYLVYHPITSLTYWGGGLEDYGATYLFALYLYEHFGGAFFISALVQEQANGVEGIEKTLTAVSYRDTFDEVFDNWTIANYLDDTRKRGGKYGYENLEIGSIDTWGYSIEYVLSNFWWGPPNKVPFAVPSYWFFGIEPQPYTAHYFRFNNKKAAQVSIDGDDFAGTLAKSGIYEWYSGAENWAWRSLYQTFTIPAGGATLNFYTFYEIEEDWDYGYVEVYDKNTGEWYTLDASGTVDNVAIPQDNPYTPNGREPVNYEAAGLWHAFTGYSGGWIPVSMNLTPFAGHTIHLYFTTWQDGAFSLQMMYVDDISIPEIGFFDDVEGGEDGWKTDGWYRTDGILDNGFGVKTIDTKWVPTAPFPEPAGNKAMQLHSASTLMVDPETQAGEDRVSATPPKSGRVKVSIVANHADHILSSHYDFGVE
ncbi:MAG TPA: hypothetical protein VMW89_10800 [Desulfatiglandales bacterium]|nr:hypothetical protein [Desulfatiglandales bacterium]